MALVYRQMRALAGRVSDLDDLTQAAAERVLRSLPSFRGHSELSTWTYRICYRTLVDQRRWYRRWLRLFRFTSDGQVPEAAEGRISAVDALEHRELLTRMREALDRIPPKRRTVVILHDLEGIELGRVATIVGANLLTVRSRLRDGRKALLRELEKDPYFGRGPQDEPPGEESQP